MGSVREFAERVLFSESLEEKLAPPEAGVVDEAQGSAIALPEAPGRPAELRLTPRGVRAGFPGVARIGDERERGRLLHFFANHELLATELMALVLLRFPEAPAEFRAGVLRTLREEQMHTKLYLRRMASCGVDFGELPVNGFFWDLVAPMETPLDYVTRLSLTFEQANLDYSRGYARVFREAGDVDTARLLERIHDDEIGHVHYGLQWFRRWREGRSDWKAFCSLLRLPMSAARAKGGFEFNAESRRAAGLDEEFIGELRGYARSKGRRPNVHWFNPGAEDELAGRRPAAAGKVERALAPLMALVARREDVVLVEEVPSLEQRLAWQREGVELPEFVAWSEADELRERGLGRARPWAATPSAVARAAALGLELEPTERRLFSKLEHAALRRELLEAGDWERLAGAEHGGAEVASVAEVERLAGRWPRLVLKAPFGTAGRERMVIEGRLDASRWEALAAWFGEEPRLLAEPWVERRLDFSIQYDRDEAGLRRRGFVVLENTGRGQFRSARVVRGVADGLPEAERRAFYDGGRWRRWLEETFEPRLEGWLGDYCGPLGVDAMGFREAGGLRLQPLLEVNPRFTMGRVALELDRFREGPGGSVLTIAAEGAEPPAGALRLNPTGLGLAAWWSVTPRLAATAGAGCGRRR